MYPYLADGVVSTTFSRKYRIQGFLLDSAQLNPSARLAFPPTSALLRQNVHKHAKFIPAAYQILLPAQAFRV